MWSFRLWAAWQWNSDGISHGGCYCSYSVLNLWGFKKRREEKELTLIKNMIRRIRVTPSTLLQTISNNPCFFFLNGVKWELKKGTMMCRFLRLKGPIWENQLKGLIQEKNRT